MFMPVHLLFAPQLTLSAYDEGPVLSKHNNRRQERQEQQGCSVSV